MKYDKIFLTNLPSFYKNNLFAEIAKDKSIYVIYYYHEAGDRNKDFFKGELTFAHDFLPTGFWKKVQFLLEFFRDNSYNELVICGWDDPVSWLMAFLSPKHKNSCIVESSVYESRTTGIKGFVKRMFVCRLSKTYPSGVLQSQLLERLRFKGEKVQSGGCGILNYRSQPLYVPRNEVKNFLYVGRLVSVKNIDMLIMVFNRKPNLNLTIVGYGDLEQELKAMACENIRFTGAIDNKELPEYYMQADVFVLPSKSEPWGLVVEEALNNGSPVIVSNRVGCRADLVSENTGLVFDYENERSLSDAIDKICDIAFYNRLREGVSHLDFAARARHQVESFL